MAANRHRVTRLGSLLIATLVLLPFAPPAAGGDKTKRPQIYDTAADGEKQIAAALESARSDNKRVLLQFGANWCSWCHKLHDLFEKDREIARKLLYEYELVLIDVDDVDGKKHNETVNKRYGQPTKLGLPVFVVLDAEGKQLTTQETGSLEEGDHHDPAKVLAFLTKWQPQPASADATLSAALADAKTQSKKVFLYFSAPWCSWCHKMRDYLDRDEIRAAFETAYVPVRIDVDRMTGGGEMMTRYARSDREGIPFCVLLDADGKKLADSRGKKGNVGFPVESFEVDHFIDIIRTHGTGLTKKQIATLRKGLEKKH